MSWFSKLFSSVGVDLTATVGKVVDELVSSDEEMALTEIQKMKIKKAYEVELKQIMSEMDRRQKEHEESLEATLTERLKLDMKSDSWLSKNIRPMALIFLTVVVSLLAAFSMFGLSDISENQRQIISDWTDFFGTIMMVVYGFYFGSRGLEKIQKIRSSGQTEQTKARGSTAGADLEPRG
ncbi:hypothetical protein [Agaribacter flavus]|uniref:Holin of 3TMs, for gene-transfer release n=1 Tax=Agaribacter flavus TaxID=1902781 RepID=A0ABV7FS89_9ALTE